jgi:hypothetical protein
VVIVIVVIGVAVPIAVPIMIMVTITVPIAIPIPIRVPGIGIAVPPATYVLEAALTMLDEAMAPSLRLLAAPAMVVDSLVKLGLVILDRAPALVFVLARLRSRRADKEKKAEQSGDKSGLSRKQLESLSLSLHKNLRPFQKNRGRRLVCPVAHPSHHGQ